MINKTEAKQLRAQGWTYQKIANIYRVSRQAVHVALSEYRSPGIKVSQRLYHERLKKQALEHYGNGKIACVKCGFDDIRALSIDHINAGGYQHKKKLKREGQNFYRWLISNSYPEGYQTLCMNCQWIKRAVNKETR